MEVKEELKDLLHRMMLKEVSKAKATNEKLYEDSYYGKEVSTTYYDFNMIQFDKDEYEMGLKFTKLLIEHNDDLKLHDLVELPNAAVVYAKYLLGQYKLYYYISYDYDSDSIIYHSQEEIDEKKNDLLMQIEKLFSDGKIDKYEKTRLINALNFIYDEDMLHKEYFQSERYTRKRTNN